MIKLESGFAAIRSSFHLFVKINLSSINFQLNNDKIFGSTMMKL